MWQDRLKTVSMVVLLTGLVWFFADQADTDSKTVSLHLSVQPPGTGYRVMAQDPEQLQFDVTFRAPRGVIREIEQELRTRLLNASFTLDKPPGDARFAHQNYESAKVISRAGRHPPARPDGRLGPAGQFQRGHRHRHQPPNAGPPGVW